MENPTKAQLLALVEDRFGAGIELVCEKPVFIGRVSMAPFKQIGNLVVYQDQESGKKYAVQVPFSYGGPV